MTAFDNLPPLKVTIEHFRLAAKKSLGQNFLLDLNLTAKIARKAAPLNNQHVIEIGPGPGGLTRALLADGAFVTAIERDERCLPALYEIARHYPGRLHIIADDALKCDYHKLVEESTFLTKTTEKPKIVANLPYNIGTELLLNWLSPTNWPPFYQSLTLMFQKEVAQRITAEENAKSYGRLGVLCNWRCHTDIVMHVPAQAFTPPPKVDSAVVQLIPREHPLPCSASVLATVTQAAFSQRRKMLRQSLKQLDLPRQTPSEFLEQLDIAPTRRAETLSIKEFVCITNKVEQLTQN